MIRGYFDVSEKLYEAVKKEFNIVNMGSVISKEQVAVRLCAEKCVLDLVVNLKTEQLQVTLSDIIEDK